MWIKHEINILLQKLDWWQKKKTVKKNILQSSSPITMQTKQKNVQISRSRGRWIIKFIEDSEQNAEYWILLSATQERILADSVCAIIVYQSMLKECVVKVANKSGNENCSQDNLCLERTRSNTPKCLGRIRIPTCYAILGKSKLQMWIFDPIPSEKAARKSHEAGNCELHKTKFKQLSGDANMTFQEFNGDVQVETHSQTVGNGNSRWTRTQIQNSTQRHHQESEKVHASGNREALTRTYDKWWKANWWNKSWWEIKKNLEGDLKVFSQRWSRSDEFFVSIF